MTDRETYYLLLDEVQLLDCFESVLNGSLRKDNMDVYVTGSNAKFLSSDIITEFAGRGDEIRMYPLSFSEFMTVYSGDRYMGLTEYMMYGGIPPVVLRPNGNDKARTLQNLFDEIYIRDIVRRNRLKKQGELEDLLNVLSSAIGSPTNPEKLKNTFHTVKNSNVTTVTINRYLKCLEDAFLIESAHRYDIKGRAYIGTPKKYYFTDIGLRNARLNFRQFEPTRALENVIYNELKMRGFNVDVGVVPVTERNSEGKLIRKQLEVDFVCNMGAARCYVQSAYSLPTEEKQQQEARPLRKIDDSFKKVIVTADIVPASYDESGVLTVNVYDFLTDPHILLF